MDVRVDADRFRESFETYSSIGRTEETGLHRLALTAVDGEVRDQFVSDLRELGLDVRIDEVGNVFGRRAGRLPDADPVMIGSHLDSQPRGGRFDGQLGVLSALETLRVFEEGNVETDRPVEIVNWTNEEGSRFNLAPLGSGVFTGNYTVEEALSTTDGDGVTVREALESIGYDGATPCEPHDIHAFVELHPEQGPHLERDGQAVGIVSGVVGMAWLRVTIHGEADHAGTTPMYARRDALTAGVNAIGQLKSLPGRLPGDAVLTVGEVDVSPGSINVIPEEAEFTVDLRSFDDSTVGEAIEAVAFEVEAAIEREREGLSADVETIFRTDHTEFSSSVRDALHRSADSLGVSYQTLVSGAGHDAMYLNEVTDAGMIFVSSTDGKSHTIDEHTPWDDAVAGANVLAETTYRLASVESSGDEAKGE